MVVIMMKIQDIKNYIDKRFQEIGNNALEEKRLDELKRIDNFIMSKEDQEKNQEDKEKEESQPEEEQGETEKKEE